MSDKKTLAILREHPELLTFRQRCRDLARETDERMRFVKKQVDNIASDGTNKKAAIWKDIADWCISRNLIEKDYQVDKSPYFLSFDDTAGTLCQVSKASSQQGFQVREKQQMAAFLMGLLLE